MLWVAYYAKHIKELSVPWIPQNSGSWMIVIKELVLFETATLSLVTIAQCLSCTARMQLRPVEILLQVIEYDSVSKFPESHAE